MSGYASMLNCWKAQTPTPTSAHPGRIDGNRWWSARRSSLAITALRPLRQSGQQHRPVDGDAVAWRDAAHHAHTRSGAPAYGDVAFLEMAEPPLDEHHRAL